MWADVHEKHGQPLSREQRERDSRDDADGRNAQCIADHQSGRRSATAAGDRYGKNHAR